MNTLATPVQSARVKTVPASSSDFHLWMVCACCVLLAISVLGCWITSIHVERVASHAVVVLLFAAMLLPLPVYWHQKGKIELRDAALTIPWAVQLSQLLPYPILIGARLRMPLRDALFSNFDRAAGVNIPEITVWARSHWMGTMLAYSYHLLPALLLAAIFVPALAGKVRPAQEFLVANVIAFAIGVPGFTLLPAVGPWYFHHFSASAGQHFAEAQLLALRLPGVYFYVAQGSGIVCFPSFHVVWAVLCAAALWWLRPLRIPLAVFSTLVILSTLTTGWHYLIDVLGGLILAFLALALARRIVHSGSGSGSGAGGAVRDEVKAAEPLVCNSFGL